MKNIFLTKGIAVLLTLAMLMTALPQLAFADVSNDISIIYTENPEPIFKNPGKGFIRYGSFNYIGSDPILFQKSMDYGAVGYQRYGWKSIEPEEGKYNWDIIDKDIEFCDANGLKMTFGIMDISNNSLIPDYVWEAGAKYETYTHTGANVKGKAPYLDDPIFQEKKGNFLKALADRYDGDDRIAYIDGRIWGDYGEGHYNAMKNTPPEPSAEVQIDLLNQYLDNFKETQIVCVASATNHGSNKLFMQIPGLGMRFDGIMSRQRNAGHGVIAGFHGVGPTVFETAGMWSKVIAGAWNGIYWSDEFSAVECQNAKVSYFDIGEWGIDTEYYIRDNEEMMINLANQIGYHFTLKETRLPSAASVGDTINVTTDWTNTGVAYMYEDCEVDFAILDSSDNVVARFKTDIVPTLNWSPDVELITETANITLPNLADGKYKLAVGLFWNERYDASDVKIGNFGRTKDGWYVIADADKSGGKYNFSFDRDTFTVNGVEVEEDILDINGTKYYPLHNVFTLLKGRVKVDGDKVTVLNDDYNLEFANMSNTFIMDGYTKTANGSIVFNNGIPYVSEKVFDAMPMINYSVDGSVTTIADTTYTHISNDYEVGIVPNGSFEEVSNAWSYNEALSTRTDELASDGKYSMKLSNTEARNTLSTRIRGEEKQVYNLKFSVKADTPVEYSVKLRYNTMLAEGKTEISDEFKEYSVMVDFTDPGFNAGMNYTNEDPILTFSTTGGGENVYIDNVRLEKFIHYDDIERDPENLVNCYDFEVSRHGWVSNLGVLQEKSLCADNPNTGNFCLKLRGKANWNGALTYVKEAVKNAGPGTYKIEFYARTDPGKDMEMYLLFGDRDNANYEDKEGANREKFVMINEDWQKIEMIETVDKAWVDGMSNCIIAMTYCRAEDVGKNYYIDSLSLKKISD